MTRAVDITITRHDGSRATYTGMTDDEEAISVLLVHLREAKLEGGDAVLKLDLDVKPCPITLGPITVPA